MKILVISYSLTGNNEALAKSIAKELAAEHIKVTEPKPRTTGTIILDTIFNRTPQVEPPAVELGNKDLIIFVGPVWLGQVATPLRAYLKRSNDRSTQYAFVSISGGALGLNPKLAGELKKRVGKEPAALINLFIADLLPPSPKPTSKETSAYRLNDKDIKNLTKTVILGLKKL